ncbi:MAG TPA: hypothetical protein VFQ14_00980 [Thermoleophilaceae bacterium]|nr:hypothetical protein [Thermoleophilaceae bacterium]
MSETRHSGSVEEVQRVAWTDERLDDLADRMDAGFARTEAALRDLRAEVGVLRTEMRTELRDMRTELKGDIGDLRTELKGDIGGLRTELDDLRTVMIRFGIAIMVCLAGVIATLIGVVVTGSVGG